MPLGVRASDAALLLFPVVLGMGSAALLAPRGGDRQRAGCGGRAPLQPPPWVFYTVWPVLYVLAGLAAALVWRASGRRATPLLGAYVAAVLALQAWWLVFANKCAPAAAFGTLVALAAAFAGLAAAFLAGPSRAAAACVAPLVAWLGFASYLSFPRPAPGAS